ncbi:MAG: ribonuclease D [Verrucomicrobiales bacterium]
MKEDKQEYHYIDNDIKLLEFIDFIRSNNYQDCAIDTEADSLHCYEEKLCLIQFATSDTLAIIDPLSIKDLSPLIDYLDTVTVWLHGSDFDIRMFSRSFGKVPSIIYDTQTASRLLGVRKFGLVNLVEDHFGVLLPKSSQKANWGMRPLSDKMLKYAINDVRYLLEIAENLSGRLKDLSRWSWFVESCAHTKSVASQIKDKDPELIWRISGWGKLERQGMAFLRQLWFWRDNEAAKRDKPTFKIIGNQELLKMAHHLEDGKDVKLPDRFPSGPVKRFDAAIDKVHQMDEGDYPKIEKRKRKKKNPDFDSRFNKLKAFRDKLSIDLGIDPTLIASRGIMEGISHDPTKFGEYLLNWQQDLLSPCLEKF